MECPFYRSIEHPFLMCELEGTPYSVITKFDNAVSLTLHLDTYCRRAGCWTYCPVVMNLARPYNPALARPNQPT